jgi:hypothetical protein
MEAVAVAVAAVIGAVAGVPTRVRELQAAVVLVISTLLL